MPRVKKNHPAMDVPLLAAVIGQLPAKGTEFSENDRASWFAMMRNAIDCVYGTLSTGPKEPETFAELAAQTYRTIPSNTVKQDIAAANARYHIDQDGFAMVNFSPVAWDAVPRGTVIHDERTGVEAGQLDSILWAGTGAMTKGLPPGVRLAN